MFNGCDQKVIDTTLETWAEQWAVNVMGPFVLCRKAVPYLKQQDKAHIVNIITMAAPQDIADIILFLVTRTGNGVIDEVSMRRADAPYFCTE